jgi:beta-glucosidase
VKRSFYGSQGKDGVFFLTFIILVSHGLSYTSFKYSDLKLSSNIISLIAEDDKLQISYTITNVGDVPGSESSQVYLTDEICTLTRPNKELKAFSKVELAPGECRVVTVSVGRSAVSFWDDDINQWRVEVGAFKVLVGSSSRKIELEGAFVLNKGGSWLGV